MLEPEAPSPPSPPLEWRRLHPVTVLRELLGLAWTLVVALVLTPSFEGSFGDWLATILPAAVVAFGVARYLATTFVITPDAVLFRRGVIFRRRTELPRDRIQNVTSGADFFGRIFSMQTVTISSAGSEGEIQLAVLNRSDASLVVGQLLGDRGGAPGTPAPLSPPELAGPPGSPAAPEGPPPPAPVADERYSLAFPQFVLYALTNPVLIVLVIGVVVLVASRAVDVSLAGLVVIGAFVVPVIAVLDLFEFRLEVEPDRLRVRHGLLSTREKWARRERVQLIEIRRPWLRRSLGYETLAVATADVSESADTRLDLCAPMADFGSWPGYAPDVMDATAVVESDLQRVSRRTVRRRAIRSFGLFSLVVVLVAAVLAGANQSEEVDSVSWWWPLAGLPLGAVGAWLLALRSYAVDGWAVSEEHLLVRRGRFSSALRLVRLTKIQDVEVRATFFQRRLGLASVLVDTANLGPTTMVPDLPLSEATAMTEQLAANAARSFLPDGV